MPGQSCPHRKQAGRDDPLTRRPGLDQAPRVRLLWQIDADAGVATSDRGTWSVFQAAARAGVGRVIFASSGQTVGASGHAGDAGTAARPISAYACTKLFEEAPGRYCCDRHGIDEQVIRTVFGRWHTQHMTRATVPGNTRTLELIVARLSP
jgi:nucleoside-diphosphate-sugar epimerase